jgi:hypothetical protein
LSLDHSNGAAAAGIKLFTGVVRRAEQLIGHYYQEHL